MAVKTVRLSEDAYAVLAALKKEGESFSEVVRRLVRGRRSLLDFAGDSKDVPATKMREYVAFLELGDELSLARWKRLRRRFSGESRSES
jgi:predicted CopG family antitoxin